MSLPENQRTPKAVEQLAQVADGASLSMIELTIAFVINHPGVTSAIVVTLNPADTSYGEQVLESALRRR